VTPLLLRAPDRHVDGTGAFPRYARGWWYDWNLQLTRFTNRIAVYFALMDDRYPSTDEQQAVHLDFPYPDVEHDLSRGLPLVKWLLAIPHYIVLFFLTIGALFAAVFAWFAILFTGHYPRSLFDFIEGVMRWHNRVAAYAFLLITGFIGYACFAGAHCWSCSASRAPGSSAPSPVDCSR
jgi:hypothetical protein